MGRVEGITKRQLLRFPTIRPKSKDQLYRAIYNLGNECEGFSRKLGWRA